MNAGLLNLLGRLLREEIFRAYVAKRAWFLVPLITLVLLALLIGVFSALRTLATALNLAARGYGIRLAGAALWLIISVGLLYVLFSWLEKRALQMHGTSR